jgi:ABC-type multidrug transport system fused ATPase/permease subunit
MVSLCLTLILAQYCDAAGGASLWIPWLVVILCLNQAAMSTSDSGVLGHGILTQCILVATTLFLGFWTSRSIPGLENGHYIAIYIALGFSQAVFQVASSMSWAILALRASSVLFGNALGRVLGSPVSFFDTTPLGRIVSRLTKDVAALDSQLWQLFDHVRNIISRTPLVWDIKSFPEPAVFYDLVQRPWNSGPRLLHLPISRHYIRADVHRISIPAHLLPVSPSSLACRVAHLSIVSQPQLSRSQAYRQRTAIRVILVIPGDAERNLASTCLAPRRPIYPPDRGGDGRPEPRLVRPVGRHGVDGRPPQHHGGDSHLRHRTIRSGPEEDC